jgi:hypothetical protein
MGSGFRPAGGPGMTSVLGEAIWIVDHLNTMYDGSTIAF